MKGLTVKYFILPFFLSMSIFSSMSIRNFDDRLLKNGMVKNFEIIFTGCLTLKKHFHSYMRYYHYFMYSKCYSMFVQYACKIINAIFNHRVLTIEFYRKLFKI